MPVSGDIYPYLEVTQGEYERNAALLGAALATAFPAMFGPLPEKYKQILERNGYVVSDRYPGASKATAEIIDANRLPSRSGV